MAANQDQTEHINNRVCDTESCYSYRGTGKLIKQAQRAVHVSSKVWDCNCTERRNVPESPCRGQNRRIGVEKANARTLLRSEFGDEKMAVQNVPVCLLYLLNFIIFEDRRRRWVYQLLRIVTICLHSFVNFCQAIFIISNANSLVDGSMAGSLLFYTMALSTLYKTTFTSLFVWKSCKGRKMQKLLARFAQVAASYPLAPKYITMILLSTVVSCSLCVLHVYVIVVYVYGDLKNLKAMFSWMENPFLETAVLYIVYVQVLYLYIFIYVFCPFATWLCMHLANCLKKLTKSLSDKIRKKEMYTNRSFQDFLDEYRYIEKLADKTRKMFSKDAACFLLLCINDLIIGFYMYIFLGKCGFPGLPLKVVISANVANFFLFVTPCCYLQSEVGSCQK